MNLRRYSKEWKRIPSRKLVIAALLGFASVAVVAQNRKDFKFNVGPGASVSLSNDFGQVRVRDGLGTQVLVTAVLYSGRVEIDPTQSGSRIDLHTHYLQPGLSINESRVDYDVTVPPDCAVVVHASGGPILIEHLHGDITAEGDGANIDVKDVGNGHVHLRTLKGSVNLSDVRNGHIEINSVSGPVTLTNVSGPRLEVNTTNGKVTYRGDFAGNGDYDITTYSGDIDVFMPTNASTDISLRSVTGKVENDFPFRPKKHSTMPLAAGKSFAGTSNQGGSSVALRSFSGTIRVKKQ
jgi:DUF4097 and DUF4098 domain-containing protein YvlB